MPVATVNGIRLSYGDTGQAANMSVLLLVHGHPFNRTMWLPQVDLFSLAGWRVLTPDLRGYGESEVKSDKVTLEALLTTWQAFLITLESNVSSLAPFDGRSNCHGILPPLSESS